ncbi:UNKNOWN [Stylonychia lemnae]|uniref:Uncharacterized protein n=1 Tax=Stylonychia lemnae TaxID=5949 RepID=A0A077ZP64_STYLE|nr:UNKNOWN [Stylonychia lemnae]|eukprot:CDW71180.1 UNKNOWN [Stylonychia lemnae]
MATLDQKQSKQQSNQSSQNRSLLNKNALMVNNVKLNNEQDIQLKIKNIREQVLMEKAKELQNQIQDLKYHKYLVQKELQKLNDDQQPLSPTFGNDQTQQQKVQPDFNELALKQINEKSVKEEQQDDRIFDFYPLYNQTSRQLAQSKTDAKFESMIQQELNDEKDVVYQSSADKQLVFDIEQVKLSLIKMKQTEEKVYEELEKKKIRQRSLNPKDQQTGCYQNENANNNVSLDQNSIFRNNDESTIKIAETICSTGVKEELLKSLNQQDMKNVQQRISFNPDQTTVAQLQNNQNLTELQDILLVSSSSQNESLLRIEHPQPPPPKPISQKYMKINPRQMSMQIDQQISSNGRQPAQNQILQKRQTGIIGGKAQQIKQSISMNNSKNNHSNSPNHTFSVFSKNNQHQVQGIFQLRVQQSILDSSKDNNEKTQQSIVSPNFNSLASQKSQKPAFIGNYNSQGHVQDEQSLRSSDLSNPTISAQKTIKEQQQKESQRQQNQIAPYKKLRTMTESHIADQSLISKNITPGQNMMQMVSNSYKKSQVMNVNHRNSLIKQPVNNRISSNKPQDQVNQKEAQQSKSNQKQSQQSSKIKQARNLFSPELNNRQSSKFCNLLDERSKSKGKVLAQTHRSPLREVAQQKYSVKKVKSIKTITVQSSITEIQGLSRNNESVLNGNRSTMTKSETSHQFISSKVNEIKKNIHLNLRIPNTIQYDPSKQAEFPRTVKEKSLQKSSETTSQYTIESYRTGESKTSRNKNSHNVVKSAWLKDYDSKLQQLIVTSPSKNLKSRLYFNSPRTCQLRVSPDGKQLYEENGESLESGNQSLGRDIISI